MKIKQTKEELVIKVAQLEKSNENLLRREGEIQDQLSKLLNKNNAFSFYSESIHSRGSRLTWNEICFQLGALCQEVRNKDKTIELANISNKLFDIEYKINKPSNETVEKP